MISIAEAHLRIIMPHIGSRAAEFVAALNDAMREWEIDESPFRVAAFLAQLAHESGEFRYMQELADGSAYEGRKDLGNVRPGDGKKFKGHGPIQITGRANHESCSLALYGDTRLVDDPTPITRPTDGCRAAGWFWKMHGLNELADAMNFKEITRRINGGYTHEAEREMYYHRALEVMGVL